MKKLIIVALVTLLLSTAVAADNLYHVSINSNRDAETLSDIGTDVLLAANTGYLVLVDADRAAAIEQSSLVYKLLASGVSREQLAMDGRLDRRNADKFDVLFEEGRIRMLLADTDYLATTDKPVEVFPLPNRKIEIRYQKPSSKPLPELAATALDDIQALMDEVEQDSLESYTYRLQAFYRRLTGTDSSYAARDWIADKFAEFGYDSIGIDPFIGSQLWARVPCQSYNVIAYKPGSLYPDQQIIIGGHFDAVPDCPGADDNATGTAAVLECARILKDVDTKMSFVFIAFDSEESWLWGSYHYVDGVIERNDDIVLMINTDMIAHYQNSAKADLYTGVENAYAQLWDQLANTYVGIDADLNSNIASDHLPFSEAGYDVIFVQEKIFSTEYHDPTDSTSYLNFEYMTRMVKATLATLYTVDINPPPIRITSLREPGDGQSQIVNWQPNESPVISFFRVSCFPTSSPSSITSVDVPSTESSLLMEGLTEGQEYGFFVQAYDALDQTSFAYDVRYATPSSVPAAPPGVLAMPLHQAIDIHWSVANEELDFDHCDVIRDGAIIASTYDTFYIDDDPSLGTDMHYYYVTSVDTDDIHSDTVGMEPAWSKAATLQPDRILAVNRTSIHPVDFVDEVETGAFMREALSEYDFVYYSDTFATTCTYDCQRVGLFDMVDYGMLVIGDEAARYDAIGLDPRYGGILDTIAYYLSIGGKAVIFGRWGDEKGWDTLDYATNPYGYDDAYCGFFNIGKRIKTTTTWPTFSTVLQCDLIGAHPNTPNYPELVWDSTATIAHANDGSPTITDVGGIPCVSFIQPNSERIDVIYTYNSRTDDPLSEGKPVAWRYLGGDYRYTFFDIPLSFFNRTAAKAALCRAIEEQLGNTTDLADENDHNLPGSFGLSQNYPNPFNPSTEIKYVLPQRARVTLSIYNILGQRVTTLVDEEQPAGEHRVLFNGTDDQGRTLATGIYMYQIKTDRFTETKKMVLLK